MPLKALCTEEACVEYKTELGRLFTPTCYMWAKKSRNLFFKQRFVVRLCWCQLKADRGLPKDFKDKITRTQKKMPPALNSSGGSLRHCKASSGLNALACLSSKMWFSAWKSRYLERERCVEQSCLCSRGANSVSGLTHLCMWFAVPGNHMAWPAPHRSTETESYMQGQTKASGSDQ